MLGPGSGRARLSRVERCHAKTAVEARIWELLRVHATARWAIPVNETVKWSASELRCRILALSARGRLLTDAIEFDCESDPGRRHDPHLRARAATPWSLFFSVLLPSASLPATREMEAVMQVMHERVAGLDVHKDSVVACVRLMSGSKATHECRTFETTTSGLLSLLGGWFRIDANWSRWKPPGSTGCPSGRS